MGGSSFSPSDAHNLSEAGPRQRGKELTRPRSALRGGGGTGVQTLVGRFVAVRVLLRSAKHLFFAAKPPRAQAGLGTDARWPKPGTVG